MQNPVHPGEVILHDVLEELELSVTEAAQTLGVAPAALSRVLAGHASITPRMANKLETAGIGNAELGLNMQSAHDPQTLDVPYITRGE